ncbi:MAG: glycosyltransferase family 10 [Methanomassiliicoccales archaeon]|nr:glycosyltransferase family 10 [Methanomassiliicoccales archaeon]
MYTVKFDNQDIKFPWGRQTPSGSYQWGDYKFVFNQDLGECDYWVVEESVPETTTCHCPPEHTVFMTGEPPCIRTYNPFFLYQFHTVVSCHRNLIHRRVINTQPALPWFIGMRWDSQTKNWKKEHNKDYDELQSMPDPKKDRLVSVITSDKTAIKGHRIRLDFVRKLEKEIGGDLDVFITNKMSLEDKWDAIGRYRYHIALENCIHTDFWSEKLADSILGLSYPIYYGCPNISDYLPNHSYTPININDYAGSLRTIKEIIYSDEREKHLDALREAKRRVLDQYNIFPLLASILDTLPPGGKHKQITIKPERKIYTRSVKNVVMGVGGLCKRMVN